MSGYNSQREVREVIASTLRMEGRNPADYNVAGIMRDAFYSRGPGYGYGAAPESDWRAAVERHHKRGRRGVGNTAHVRYHSSDDMAGLGELRETAEPVAVVIRPDGSVDVYGYVGIVDQREHGNQGT